MLDVNAGIPLADEPQILADTIRLVQSITDVPLSIDSSIVAALEAGLAAYVGRPLLKQRHRRGGAAGGGAAAGQEVRLRGGRDLQRRDRHLRDPDVRFAVAKKIVERAADYGIKPQDIVVDPLVMPVGAINSAGQQVFRLVRRLREELKVNTTCGASKHLLRLPNRRGLNMAFLAMAAGAGMTSAIMNPLHEEDMLAIRGADVMNGRDPDCRRWIRKYREPAPEGEQAGRRRARCPGRTPPPARGRLTRPPRGSVPAP